MLTSDFFGIADLVSVNFQCFGLIILGYLSKKFNLIGSKEANGLNTFVSYFSLPALIFQSLATLPLLNIDFNLVGCILLSKSIVFIAVVLITFVLSYKPSTKIFTIQRSAIFGIFCTQSNDFALGYPLMISLYGNSKTSLANYLYILAPIQLLILNPIGLFLIEFSKSFEENEMPSNYRRYLMILKILFRKIFINPIIFSTFLGIIINFANNGSLPQVTVPLFETLSQSFSSLALFLLGLNLYGNFKLFNNFSQPLLIALVLVSVKIFIMPILNREFMQHFKLFPESHQNVSMSDFAFLYGTIPAAPTVYIFSNFYNIETLIISAGLVISTIFSAPLMFVSANMIRMSAEMDFNQLSKDQIDTIFYISVVSIIGSLLLLISFFFGFKMRSITHRYSFKIIVSHIIILIGGILYKFNSGNSSFGDKVSIVQYLLFNIGLFCLKLWTCLLSIILVLLYVKSLCYVIRISDRLIYLCLFIIIGYIVFICSTFKLFLSNSPNLSSSLVDLYYGVGKVHLSISIFISCLSITISIIAFICLRYYKYNNNNTYNQLVNSTLDPPPESDPEPLMSAGTSQPRVTRSKTRMQQTSSVIEVEDLYLALPRNLNDEGIKDTCNLPCHSYCPDRKVCGDQLRRYKLNIESAIEAVELTPSPFQDESFSNDFHQIFHHMYLIIFFILSTAVHLGVEICHLIREKPSAIYMEIEFLDIVLTFSQGLIMFIIFGLDIDSIVYKLYKVFNLNPQYRIYLPALENLSPDTFAVCDRFCEQYVDKFIEEVAFTLNDHSFDHYGKVYFCGHQLIDWLLKKRITSSRKDALNFGRHLLYGRVIEHITNQHFFCDNTYYYRVVINSNN